MGLVNKAYSEMADVFHGINIPNLLLVAEVPGDWLVHSSLVKMSGKG
jgi:hypothetical protein